MSKTLTAVAAALALVFVYPAMAASKYSETKATAESCKALETQVDAAAKTHANSPKFKEAEAARTEGTKLCAEGKYAEGSEQLHHALKQLGMKVSKSTY